MSREAIKLALEALEYIHKGANNQGPHTGISWLCVSNKSEPAITALREALAEQPAQQEPVAWMREGWGPDCGPYIEFYRDDEMGWRDRKEWTALYTSAQRTWVNATTWRGLTDEQFQAIKDSLFRQEGWDGEGWDLALKEAIEAKLKEKNNG